MTNFGGPMVDQPYGTIGNPTGALRDFRVYLVVGLAALLHVLVNVVSTDAGLRVMIASPSEFAGSTVRFAISDPVLVLVLVVVATDWLMSGLQLPEARLKLWWLWLAGLTVWMAVSLITGRLSTGEWIRWAYLNKGVGWLVLTGYFAAGIWIADRGRLLAVPALATFVGMGWLVSAIGFAAFLIFVLFPDLTDAERFFRPQGLASNPNAFAISIAAIVVIQLPLMKAQAVYRPLWFRIGLSLMMLAFAYAGSRSAWVGLAAGLAVLLAFRQIPLREILIAALLALIINLLTVDLLTWSKKQTAPVVASETVEAPNAAGADVEPVPPPPVVRDPYHYLARDNVLSDEGLSHRLITAKQAISDWGDNPVFGVGLGGFLWRHGGSDDPLRGIQIHATPLWLLVETGIVGASLFAAFFFATLFALLRRNGRWVNDPVLIGIAAAIVVVGASSVGTEILYQRYLWFLAGLGLAWPGLEAVRQTKADEA